ncbi:hypothetical protein [Paraburkholderia elongata]|uniref:hypothetical protein n=1 Tax=Paraburkholderia elongata TaxID=2675747 RepID=UPI001F2E4596|nr:hypothetical protein [Paraburkholderia elongata]
MVRTIQHIPSRPFFNERSCVQNSDAVAQPCDDGEIVADEQDGCTELLPKVSDQIDYTSLDCCVESGCRFVED